MIEKDFEFSCPYCGEVIYLRIDASAGNDQAFIYDCEVCCRPIQIRIEIEGEDVISFMAEASD